MGLVDNQVIVTPTIIVGRYKTVLSYLSIIISAIHGFYARQAISTKCTFRFYCFSAWCRIFGRTVRRPWLSRSHVARMDLAVGDETPMAMMIAGIGIARDRSR